MSLIETERYWIALDYKLRLFDQTVHELKTRTRACCSQMKWSTRSLRSRFMIKSAPLSPLVKMTKPDFLGMEKAASEWNPVSSPPWAKISPLSRCQICQPKAQEAGMGELGTVTCGRSI